MDRKTTNLDGQTEFSLKELIGILWGGRILVIVLTALATMVAGIAAWTLPKTFEASVVISPAADTSAGQFGGTSALGQFSGLASLAGLSTGGDSKKAESLAVLQSETLTERYIHDNDLLPVLFADKWDAAAGKWKIADPLKVPTLWKGNEFFREHVRSVVTNPKTGLVTLTIAWKDPVLAAKWANDLVKTANDYLRTAAIATAERNVAFLGQEAGKTDVVGVKQAIYSILQNEIDKMMLARGSEEYAFRVLDRAVPPEKASAPRKLLWLAGGFAGGLCLSVLIVLTRVARIS